MSMKPCCVLISAFIWLASGQQAKSALPNDTGDGTILGALENRLFCHAFRSEPADKRVQRLETFVFGRANTNENLNSRISHIVENVPPTTKLQSNNSASGAPHQINQLHQMANYPAVTQLELDILKTTYENDTVVARIDRLELAQFGRTFKSSDLAGRVDTLRASAAPTRLMQNIELHSMPNPLLGAQAMSPATVVDKIEVLEKHSFGRIYPGRPLQKRVESLEKNVLGISAASADNAITQRVAQLWEKVALADLPHT